MCRAQPPPPHGRLALDSVPQLFQISRKQLIGSCTGSGRSQVRTTPDSSPAVCQRYSGMEPHRQMAHGGHCAKYGKSSAGLLLQLGPGLPAARCSWLPSAFPGQGCPASKRDGRSLCPTVTLSPQNPSRVCLRELPTLWAVGSLLLTPLPGPGLLSQVTGAVLQQPC